MLQLLRVCRTTMNDYTTHLSINKCLKSQQYRLNEQKCFKYMYLFLFVMFLFGVDILRVLYCFVVLIR